MFRKKDANSVQRPDCGVEIPTSAETGGVAHPTASQNTTCFDSSGHCDKSIWKQETDSGF